MPSVGISVCSSSFKAAEIFTCPILLCLILGCFCFWLQGDLDTGQGRSLDSQDALVGFSAALLHRKDPSQRQLNFHLAPPNPPFPQHPGPGSPFPPQYRAVSRLPYRVGQPQHPAMAPQQQQQLSPVYSSSNHNASFFSGPTHRGAVQSPSTVTADGPDSVSVEELTSSVRAPLGHHQTVMSHHNRVNSFGEDPSGQDGTFSESLGESIEKLMVTTYVCVYIY